ncbi:MAG TPA: efflux RND transporter permease subunit, partial [Alphaproteobacteria bacterium]|nr:efflux RND transporter permease subunit [Alphaproteobacteria bacterium]
MILETILKRPIFVFLISLGILVYGSIIVGHMGVSALPKFSFQTLSVETTISGASSSQVALSVTKPLEKELIKLQNLKTIRSYSSKGYSLILLDLDENANLDSSYLEAALITKAQEGKLPKSLSTPPVVSKSNPTQAPIYFIAVRSLTKPRQEVTRLAINVIAPQFSMIPGVNGVKFLGLADNAYRVQVDADALYQHNLSFLELYETLSNNLTPYALGAIQTKDQAFSLELEPKYTTLEKLRTMIVPLKNGEITYLKDLAVVQDSFVNDKSSSVVFGQPAAVFGITPKDGANTIDIAKQATALMGEIQKTLPEGIQLQPVFDRTEQIRTALFDMELAFIVTILLVMAVVYLFLKRIGLVGIVSVIIILSMLATCSCLYLMGKTLNVVSFLGLIISVGFVVDDAVIVIEAIVRRQEEGESPYEASLKGVKEIFFTVMSISLSLIVVFFPLIAAPGLTGQLLGDFSLAIIFAVVFSLFFSFLIIPVFITTFKTKPIKQGKSLSLFSTFYPKLLKFYEKTLLIAFKYSKTVLVFSFFLSVVSVVLFIKIPHSLFP